MAQDLSTYDIFELREIALQLLTERAGIFFHKNIREQEKENPDPETISSCRKEYEEAISLSRDYDAMGNKERLIEIIKLYQNA